MSNIFHTLSESKPNTWIAWFILGMCLTVVLENPVFIILGAILASVHKILLQDKE